MEVLKECEACGEEFYIDSEEINEDSVLTCSQICALKFLL